MAETEERSRSRSPPGSAPATGGTGVPTHWGTGGGQTASAESSAPAKKGKGGGKKGFRPGANAEILDEKRTEEELTPALLLAIASKVEAGDKELEPAQIAKILRQAATRVGALEKNMEDIGQTIRTINSLTGRALASTGLLAGEADMPMQHILADEPSGGGQSYMIKKADEDVQEAHRFAAQSRPATVGSTSSGGALSAEAKSREEMEKARKERMMRLQQQQTDKSREKEGADAKSRAREALGKMVGPTKTLGRF